MKKSFLNLDSLVVFTISFITTSLELFLTRILYLKAWNHVVYIVIPRAILGYGIGANIYLIFKTRLQNSSNGIRINFEEISFKLCFG